MLKEKIHQLEEGATTSVVSGHQSHNYGKFWKAMCDVFQDNCLFIGDLFNELHGSHGFLSGNNHLASESCNAGSLSYQMKLFVGAKQVQMLLLFLE